MEAKYIIADSGGTKTSWAIVGTNGEVTCIQTPGLHPKYVFGQEDLLAKLKEHFSGLEVPLYFYGAGCSTPEIQEKMRHFLEPVGFSSVDVYPDTLAACRALYGSDPGWIAILGTGSVLVQYDGAAIVNRAGGFGSLVGDEGSGFYFGRLLTRFLLETEKWDAGLEELFQSKEAVLAQLAGPDALKWISGLAARTAHLDLAHLHAKNAKLFIEAYCTRFSDLKEIATIGTYGYEQSGIFKEAFEANGIRVKKQISSPLEDLVHYHKMNGK